MTPKSCPKCQSIEAVKAGIVQKRQRYKCKTCGYHYSVDKVGKRIPDYYQIKALQLYIEGLTYREIERILGISHVTVMNWVRSAKLKRPVQSHYHPTYKILNHKELIAFISQPTFIKDAGMIITEVGDKFMVIRWERFAD